MNKEREKFEVVICVVEVIGKLKVIFVIVDVFVIFKREDDECVKLDIVLLVVGVKS